MFNKAQVSRFAGSNDTCSPSTHSDVEAGSVRRVMADVAELVELQVRLAVSDLKCLVASTIRPLVLVAISLVLVLGSLPVLLFAAGSLLVEEFGWELAPAQLTVAGVAIALAAVLGALAVKGLMACGPPLRSSVAEFEKNMESLREMLGGQDALERHLERLERRNRGT